MKNKTIIIAEAGVNHNGNINLAKKLIIEASKQIYAGSTDKKQAVSSGKNFVKVRNSNAASRG